MSQLAASRYAIPGVLALIGLATALAATHGAFWPLALVWVSGILLLIGLSRLFEPTRIARTVTAGLVVVACPILTFEGGLFLFPAALALLIIEVGAFRCHSKSTRLT